MLLKSQLKEDNQHIANQAISVVNSNPNALRTACQGNLHNSSLQGTAHSTWINHMEKVITW